MKLERFYYDFLKMLLNKTGINSVKLILKDVFPLRKDTVSKVTLNDNFYLRKVLSFVDSKVIKIFQIFVLR